MVNRCCILGCNSATHNRNGKKIENGLTFHRFPAWKRSHGDQASEITKSRRLAWIAAVRRPNLTFHSIPMSMRVCSLHFHSDMVGQFCSIRDCHSRSHDRSGRKLVNGVRFFSVPSWKKQQGKQVEELTRRRRIAWVAALRRKNYTFHNIPASTRVCSRHFSSGKPSYEMLENHPDWKPSLRLGHSEVKQTDEARFQRLVKRRTQHQKLPSPAQHQEQDPPLAQHQEPPPSPEQYQEPLSPEQYQEPLSPEQYQEPLSPEQYQEPLSPEQECALCTHRQDVINCLLEENRKLKEELKEYRMNGNF
ncbi:uncharacterized protein LOC143718258 isoform X1 [Siphateles boraxobius]|uniref:uncharacterized protein LOC143718258 isoform X1 n=1 Tax=Siphateles boraxobius TaxID=180520 RepID=UPI004064355A